MPVPTKKKRIMIIAGEASGDAHGAGLISAMMARNRHLECFGVGGPALRSAGVRILVDAAEIAVMGITEVLSHAPAVLRSLRSARRMIRTLHPDLLILVDFPEFNLNMAAYAKRFGVPVLYYIAPQVWAWRRGRVNKIRQRVDHMAVILPFEESFFRKRGVPVTYVGHPLRDHADVARPSPRPAACRQMDAPPVIGLLPGSRKSEVERLMVPMLETVGRLSERMGPVRCRVAKASTLQRAYLDAFLHAHRPPAGVAITIDDGGAASVFAAADFVITASGTATLEAALAGVPMAVVYRISALSYHIGRRLVKVPHISLVNLIAGREVVPEFIQDEATPERIAATVRAILQDPQRIATMKRELAKVRRRIGGSGASRRVAGIALELVNR